MEYIDISQPIGPGTLVYPGDPPARVERLLDAARGDPYTLSQLSMSAHLGTHVDAPLHLFGDGAAIDALDLTSLCGPCRVLDVRARGAVDRAFLEAQAILPGERVLFATAARDAEGGGYLAPEAAAHLVAHRVRAVGIDSLSVDPLGSADLLAHQALLSAGIPILEGLRLAGVAAGRYRLLCLPLKLEGAEGAPARAILLPSPPGAP